MPLSRCVRPATPDTTRSYVLEAARPRSADLLCAAWPGPVLDLAHPLTCETEVLGDRVERMHIVTLQPEPQLYDQSLPLRQCLQHAAHVCAQHTLLHSSSSNGSSAASGKACRSRGTG